ncbi:hypothetical protein D3C72_772250 [compost metagenome]
MQRVKRKLRCRGQPAHPLGAHVKVDQVAGEFGAIRQRREQLLSGEFFITPLAGVVVEERSAVHLTRRAVPVEGKRQRQPAGLRTQLLLADIVRPAAAAFADTAAEDKHIDHPTVVHVHVIPVVHARTENDHRPSMGFMSGIGEFTGDLFNMATRYAGDLLAPGWGVGFDFGVIFYRVVIFQPAIQSVVRQDQIVNAGDLLLTAIGEGQGFRRHFADQHRVLLHAAKVRVFIAAEVGERHIRDLIVGDEQRERQLRLLTGSQRLQVPFAFFTPAETN